MLPKARPADDVGTLKGLVQQSDVQGLRYLAVESSVALGEALLKAGQPVAAQGELERAIAQGEKLGTRGLLVRGHHLMGLALRQVATSQRPSATSPKHGVAGSGIDRQVRSPCTSDCCTRPLRVPNESLQSGAFGSTRERRPRDVQLRQQLKAAIGRARRFPSLPDRTGNAAALTSPRYKASSPW